MSWSKLVFSGLLFLLSSFSWAQNLVPNPSFEAYYDCPEFLGSVKSYNPNSPWGLLPEWQANPPDCTPDYYHPCGRRKFKVPKNLCGNRAAKDGKAYVGMILRIGEVHIGSWQDLFYREHITAGLKDSLRKDHRYLVSFYVCLSEYANFAIGHIGAFFSKKPIIIHENQAYTPQILSSPQVIQSKEDWVLIQDTLTAKGGEKYITIGNFDDYRHKKIRKIVSSQKHIKKFNFNRAYYYLDMVSVVDLGLLPPPRLQTPSLPTPPVWKGLTDLQVGQKIVLEEVFFAFDQADLLPASFPELNRLCRLLAQYPKMKIRVIGHTDSIGTQTKNQMLSEQRAHSVVSYLQSQGIAPERMFSQGYGEDQPIDTNTTPEGRQQNRRVEFAILEY